MLEKVKYTQGALAHTYYVYESSMINSVDGGVIEEALLTIYVNAQEVATIMCSPLDEEALTIGFLYNEGVIDSLHDIALIKPNGARTVMDVFLGHSDFSLPRRLTITSGCGGGIMLQNLLEQQPPLESDFSTVSESILARMRDLHGSAKLYQQVRGVHTAILADENRLLLSAEDVGRHNTIDKITGKALLEGIDTCDKILLASGRISSEMVSKARRMAVPIVASRTAPTSFAVQLAEAWGICLVGYVRQGSFRVYTQPQRLGIII
jgi:FdhD protein